MPIVKTTVTGPILDVTGTAYTKAVVRFTPRGVGGDDAADTVLAQTPVEVMPATSTGAFSIDLAPSDTIAYDVVLAQFLPDRERVYKIGAIYVPSTGPVALEDLLPVFDPSLPTNAELLAALSAAVAEAEAAADRAEAANNSFATIAALAAADTLEDGLVYGVDDGYNGEPETFQYNATSTATADGALIVTATGMGVGRLISQRTTFKNSIRVLADRRAFAVDTVLTVRDGYSYTVLPAVSTDQDVTNAGGAKLRVNEGADGYDARAFGDLFSTDATAVVQSGVNAVMGRGGKLKLPSGNIIISNLILTDPDKTFSIEGQGRATVFKSLAGSGLMFFSDSSSAPYTLRGFDVDCRFAATSAADANGPISLEDMSGCWCDDIHVRDYKNTGIQFAAGVADTSTNNLMTNCYAFGLGVANNGLSIIRMNYSGYVNCHSFGTGGVAPGAGIQFKQDCKYCYDVGCSASDGRIGHALAQDAGVGPSYHTSTNFRSVSNYLYGAVVGFGTRNTATGMYIDVDNAPGAFGISFGGDCVGNNYEATIENVAATWRAVEFAGVSTDNAVKIPYLSGLAATAKVVKFGADTERNSVSVDRIEPASIASGGPKDMADFSSTANSNSFKIKDIPFVEWVTLSSGAITLKNAATKHVAMFTEASAATDDLETINGNKSDGRTIYLRTLSNSQDVVIKDQTGNIRIGADRSLLSTYLTQILRWNAGVNQWTN